MDHEPFQGVPGRSEAEPLVGGVLKELCLLAADSIFTLKNALLAPKVYNFATKLGCLRGAVSATVVPFHVTSSSASCL